MPSKKAVKKGAKRKTTKVAAKTSHIVFVSYSSNDRWIAGQIKKELELLGAKVLIDQKDIKGGDILPAKIIELVNACTEAIVLVSKSSAKSLWVAFEIGALRAKEKLVTPILNSITASAMGPMKDVVARDLNEFDKYLSELEGRIGGR